LTALGRPRSTFRRALERENLLIAEAVARELGRITLVEALELTALVARKDPKRRGRVAARWLLRFLEDHERVTIDEAVLVAGALAALGGAGHDAAFATLLELAEQGSRRAIGNGP
jgi:hypothetical protein